MVEPTISHINCTTPVCIPIIHQSGQPDLRRLSRRRRRPGEIDPS